ncbi:major royal jelly [Fusarium denticulatum]|uniref:Major royal jelly n=1 Tax=Fusarium denticulatum TaxID=48507 RepID=A0A8H5UKN5_9HYPO|nr:major royal jelly [Fusarium denticulatum]
MSIKHNNQPIGMNTGYNRPSSRRSLPAFSSLAETLFPTQSIRDSGKHKVVRWEDQDEYKPSLPFSQFKREQEEERGRLEKLMNDHPINRPQLDPAFITEEARKVILARWKEEGIWDDAWEESDGSTWRWSHERDHMEKWSGDMLDLPSGRLEQPTRPISRFLHQIGKLVSKALEENAQKVHWRQACAQTGFDLSPSINYGNKEESIQPIDRIGTTAFEIVKHTWQQRGIWDDSWGDLPGYAWKHERHREGFSLDSCVHSPALTTPTEIGAPYAVMGVPASMLQDQDQESYVALPPDNAVLPTMADSRVNYGNDKSNSSFEIAQQASPNLERSRATDSMAASEATTFSHTPPKPQRKSSRISKPSERCRQSHTSERRDGLRPRTSKPYSTS